MSDIQGWIIVGIMVVLMIAAIACFVASTMDFHKSMKRIDEEYDKDRKEIERIMKNR